MKRFILNISLLLLLILTMGYHYLPQIIHEILGVFLILAGIWHLYLNKRWFNGLLKGAWNKLRCFQSFLGILLTISFITAVTTGVIISNYLFRELWVGVAIHRSIFIHQLHIASSYFMIILGGMHIGMNWIGLWNRLKKLSPFTTLSQKPILAFWVQVFIFWIGCAFSRLDHIGDRLLMKHIFGTPASQFPALVYYGMLLCVMGLYAIGFFKFQKYMQNLLKREIGD